VIGVMNVILFVADDVGGLTERLALQVREKLGPRLTYM
jgi:hypothetical protein